MNYGLKYYMEWLSERGNDFRIEIQEKDFTGEARLKKLGSAPVLRIDNADNGIIGTSLQFLLQADVDGELEELYTTDSKKYKVLLKVDGSTIWEGYILQELYSEEYIAPPYDVSITATDQIALLKDIAYTPTGRNTLLAILKNALKPTNVDNTFAVQSSLKPSVMNIDSTFLNYVTLNDYAFADKSCYDAIGEILTTCGMTLMSFENMWMVFRQNDYDAPVYLFDKNLQQYDKVEITQTIIGRMGENKVYPSGSLMLTKIAAKKKVSFSYVPRQAQSMLIDPAMLSGDGWFWNLSYIHAKPGRYALEGNAPWLNNAEANVNAFILESSLDKTKDFALWQNVKVEAVNAVVKIQFSYLPLNSGKFASNEGCEKTVKLALQIKLVTADQTYYLNKAGWSTEDMENLVFTGSMLADTSAARRADKSQYTTSVIEVPSLPANGMLTISFRNDSRIRPTQLGGPSDTDENETFRVYPRMGITDVFITLPEIVGYNTDVAIASGAAQEGGEFECAFADAYGIANEDLVLYNFLSYGDNIMQSKWKLQNVELETFYTAIIQDKANTIGKVKNGFSGTITGKKLLNICYVEKYSDSKLRLLSGEYNLLTDELSGQWEEATDAMVEIAPYETTINNNSSVVVPSGSTSSTVVPGGGGGTSSGITMADVEGAIAPIKDWFDVKETTEGERYLHTKYTIASDGDVVAGSDMRYKRVEEKFRLTSTQIAHAPLFKFQWKKQTEGMSKIGTSAQYWENIIPELVVYDSVADFKRLNYQSLGVAMGISLAREIEYLKKQIAELKEQLKNYEQ